MYNKLQNKFNNNLPGAGEAIVENIVKEIKARLDSQGFNCEHLLVDSVILEVSEFTGDINLIDKDNPLDLFWSFDASSGELVGT